MTMFQSDSLINTDTHITFTQITPSPSTPSSGHFNQISGSTVLSNHDIGNPKVRN